MHNFYHKVRINSVVHSNVTHNLPPPPFFLNSNYRIAATTPATARRTPAVLRALSAALLVFSAAEADSVAVPVSSASPDSVAEASEAVAVAELVLVPFVEVP
jgi:hypothetical protein